MKYENFVVSLRYSDPPMTAEQINHAFRGRRRNDSLLLQLVC